MHIFNINPIIMGVMRIMRIIAQQKARMYNIYRKLNCIYSYSYIYNEPMCDIIIIMGMEVIYIIADGGRFSFMWQCGITTAMYYYCYRLSRNCVLCCHAIKMTISYQQNAVQTHRPRNKRDET